MSTHSAELVEIVVVDENWVDMLLPDRRSDAGERESISWRIERCGLIDHFNPLKVPPQAENGISLLVRVGSGGRTYCVLFDVGLTGDVIKHNLNVLNENPRAIDHVVISHGHPDHYGGIFGLLELLRAPVPISTHPDAFLARYVIMPDGRVGAFYNAAFSQEELMRRGGRVVMARDPLHLAPGLFTTGEIPRTVEFEGPRVGSTAPDPGLYQVSPDGKLRVDEVWDEQGLVVRLENGGLIVLTGCAHAGVVNTIARAKAIGGDGPILAVMGGFHLGFPTTPPENLTKTLDAFRSLDVRMVIPMHCSGLAAHRLFSTEMGRAYLQPAVGSRLFFGGRNVSA
jgi:7,8-dihydropterin-6-yl-methyl-4-(beta-D-ribofuranosyl)aminobenzene 5'-phosphate synthase